MAIVEFAAPITSIKGSIGGWTFQANNSGNIIRLKGTRAKSITAKQTLAQQNFFEFVQKWQTLTFAEKLLWDAYGVANTKENKFGITKTLTGMNWYQSINSNLQLMGEPLVTSPPAHILPPAVAAYNLTFDATKIEITFGAPFSPANSQLLIWATYPTTQTTNLKRQALKQIVVLDSAPYTTIDITSAWETAVGMSYPPPGTTPCYSIASLVQTIEKTSGIASPGLADVTNTNLGAGGIGVMIIGSTFIVG